MYYYKHHIGDFRSGTSNMSRQERWLYRDMLDVYYDKESPLPLDLQDVCDSIGATDEESKSVAKILRLKFNLGETGWVHERCEVELDTYRANAEKARDNGKKGGRPRKNNPPGSLPVASGMQDGTGWQPDCNPEESGSQANHKPLTTNHKPPSKVKPTVPASAETAEVFEYWKQAMNHPAAQLDAKRSKNIGARLKDGYTVGQLCRAVDGCKYDPFSQGANDRQTVYDDIELICRDGPKVDKFMAIADRGPQQTGRTVNQQKTLTNLERYLQENPS